MIKGHSCLLFISILILGMLFPVASIRNASNSKFLITNAAETNHHILYTRQNNWHFQQAGPQQINLARAWNRTYSQSQYDIGYGIVECRDGGYAISGLTTQHDSEYGYRYDLWLFRTDLMGNPLWNFSFGNLGYDAGFDIVECSDGGFAILGYTEINNKMDFDIYLIRTDAWGRLLWNRTYGKPGLELGYSIIRCRTGGFAVLACVNYRETLLLRLDNEGNHLWNQTFDIAPSRGNKALVECEEGGFAFIAGTEPYYYSQVYLVRTDAGGNIIWNQTFGGEASYTSRGLVKCHDGGFAIAGAIREVGANDWDIWLVRTNSQGALRWNYTYDSIHGEIAESLIQTWWGGFVMAGMAIFSNEFYDVKIIMTSQTGQLIMADTIGGAFHEKGFSIAGCKDGGFAITGTINEGETGWDLLLIRVPADESIIYFYRLLWSSFFILFPLIISISISLYAIRLLKQQRS